MIADLSIDDPARPTFATELHGSFQTCPIHLILTYHAEHFWPEPPRGPH